MRSIDLNYPSNRYAVGGSLGVLLLSRLSGRSWSASGRAAALSFAAWAVARELDPDHPESASVALPIAGILAWMEGERSAPQVALEVAGSGAVLTGVRYVTGSVGATPGQSDQMALLGAAMLSALSAQHGAALLPALAETAVAAVNSEEFGPQAGLGLAALLPSVLPRQASGPLSRLAALASLLLAAQMVQPEEVEATTDQGTAKISAPRVRAARMMSVGAAALSALEGRGSAPGVLAAVNLAVGLRRLRR